MGKCLAVITGLSYGNFVDFLLTAIAEVTFSYSWPQLVSHLQYFNQWHQFEDLVQKYGRSRFTCSTGHQRQVGQGRKSVLVLRYLAIHVILFKLAGHTP